MVGLSNMTPVNISNNPAGALIFVEDQEPETSHPHETIPETMQDKVTIGEEERNRLLNVAASTRSAKKRKNSHEGSHEGSQGRAGKRKRVRRSNA
jgi:hypothetical protein